MGVGRTGWHIDGSFQERPYSHSLYHIISVPSRGDTGNGMLIHCALHTWVQILSILTKCPFNKILHCSIYTST